MAVTGSGHDGERERDVLRRAGEASVLILTSLADGGPGTLYGALDRLESLGLIQALPAEDRRHPYRITSAGAIALRDHLDSLERVSAVGRLRLGLGGV